MSQHETRTDRSQLLQQLENQAHVWFANPAHHTNAALLNIDASLLSPEERDRYSRFKFEKDQLQFLVSHALVRKVLSSYVDIEPWAWQFSYSSHGRPEISAPNINTPLRFNLTHTDGLVACLVTLNADCGIDAENYRLPDNPMGIAKKMFSAAEQHELSRLQGQAFLERFFTYWTLREAYCKAIGLGLSSPMDYFSFEPCHQDQFRIKFDAPPDERAEQWTFTTLRPSPEHIASIAICANKPAMEIIVQQPFIS